MYKMADYDDNLEIINEFEEIISAEDNFDCYFLTDNEIYYLLNKPWWSDPYLQYGLAVIGGGTTVTTLIMFML